MLPKNLIFLVACGAATLSRAESEKLKWPGTLKIDEPCHRDRECIRHAFCKAQKACLCETFYAPSLDKATCHVTVGALCNDADNYQGCETMSNAECRQNVCTCRDNFMIDMNNSSNCIIRPRAPGDICYRIEDCRETMEKANCIDNKCRCYTNYHFVNETGKCIKTRGLYLPCENNYECFIDEKHPNEMECKNGECRCRQGESSCNKGSLLHQPIFLVFAGFAFRTIYRALS